MTNEMNENMTRKDRLLQGLLAILLLEVLQYLYYAAVKGGSTGMF